MPEPNAYSTSRKRLLMRSVLKLCRDLRHRGEQPYEVRRGAVNWAAWDFDSRPLAVSVHCDETSFMRGAGENDAAVSLEMLTRMPDAADQLDDDLLDDMVDDAVEVFERLEEMRDPEDPALPVVSRIDRSRDSAIEVSDAQSKVMGVVATVFLYF